MFRVIFVSFFLAIYPLALADNEPTPTPAPTTQPRPTPKNEDRSEKWPFNQFRRGHGD